MGTARRLADLDHRRRRWAVLRAVLAVAATWALLGAVYYLVPARNYLEEGAGARVVVGGALFAGVLVWQIRRILRAPLPQLRAIEALGAIIALFLLLFATTYLALSHTSPASFNQHLDHTRALYFTISIFSTVGFGDIVPRTDTARILVSAQMLLDLILLGAVVKLLVTAARTGLGRAHPGPPW
ncbi:potassium channel family protein [Rhodococcus opacus]|uniref:Potassium channel family protein n=1 Tax=Rhodococcus opacus TaxID=37919 RepID=A0AAX3Y5W6_RHOOP|nr:potassium channel family protein [Rhodococcus opacus]ELB94003.1 ion transport 2 domain-containing protein [Rhodococcus wratislaviensis IFP 2016]MBA8964635.1 voltage-gated potassium channel Kch [Rhodococcus opacus]MBP2207403.1 voltage-gated potassium channel Kch [Rhodococcus opacus]MCZ4586205.1 potassium channel family protein [Rhodococcus opacus]MDJ0417987.1 potassium channel family protein [Rhodococcus opacus]